MTTDLLTVRELRRRWKPKKEQLAAARPDHPTAIRLHRAFSWLARAERADDGDEDVRLLCHWIAFNSLYSQWNESEREPLPDRDCWRRFIGRVLELDAGEEVAGCLVLHRRLVMSLLDDEYLSSYFWEEPTSEQAKKARREKFRAQTWYLERRWLLLLERLLERVYLLRCQLVHGAATHGGKLNRTALRRASLMCRLLAQGFLLVIIEHGAEQDWGPMCYPPLR